VNQGGKKKEKAGFSMEGKRNLNESQTGAYLKKHQEKVYNSEKFNQSP
jgi:hypothetical protein